MPVRFVEASVSDALPDPASEAAGTAATTPRTGCFGSRKRFPALYQRGTNRENASAHFPSAVSNAKTFLRIFRRSKLSPNIPRGHFCEWVGARHCLTGGLPGTICIEI